MISIHRNSGGADLFSINQFVLKRDERRIYQEQYIYLNEKHAIYSYIRQLLQEKRDLSEADKPKGNIAEQARPASSTGGSMDQAMAEDASNAPISFVDIL